MRNQPLTEGIGWKINYTRQLLPCSSERKTVTIGTLPTPSHQPSSKNLDWTDKLRDFSPAQKDFWKEKFSTHGNAPLVSLIWVGKKNMEESEQERGLKSGEKERGVWYNSTIAHHSTIAITQIVVSKSKFIYHIITLSGDCLSNQLMKNNIHLIKDILYTL